MKKKLEEIWEELESEDSPHGILKRLLNPDWAGELSAALVKPGNKPALLLELGSGIAIDTSQLAASNAVDLRTSGDDSGIRVIQITLDDPKFRDTFSILAADLAEKTLATSSEEDGARALVYGLGRWLRFLKKRRIERLSGKRLLGLYGELAVLIDLVAPAIGLDAAVRAWVGPTGVQQDFELQGVAIEVKTLAVTQPQQLTISSERQLDDRGLAALVVAHLAVDERKDTGRSVPGLVEAIRTNLSESGSSQEEFDEKLFEIGYFDQHAHIYIQTGYVARSDAYYRVSQGFPRLIEADLSPGVGGLMYKVDASACRPFAVSADQVRSWLSEAPSVADPVAEDESDVLEHKQTVWKAQLAQIPDTKVNEGVVKSVAGFLNANGGTLVIGVEDRTGKVVGIAPDLEHLGIDEDAYLNRLTNLLLASLGQAASTRVAAQLEETDGHRVCLLRVRSSPRPVFAQSPVSKDRSDVFWVRVNNTTREFNGKEMVRYIRDHWG